MAVIPSFARYVPAPDLAGAHLGARRADIAGFEALTQFELGQRRIAQEAAESQARIALGYETLEARKVENEMELAAKQATEQREHLRRQQEAEILKSYRDTQIGLAERRLAIAEAEEKQRIQDVAAAFDRDQLFQRRRTELREQGIPDAEADRQAFLDTSYGQPGTVSALSPAREPAERRYSVVAGQDILGTPTRLPMTAPEFQAWLPTAPPQLRTNTVNMAIQGMLQQPSAGTNAPANEVIRRTKEGRRAVFNAQTKQFIRFAD